jgi:hypothetical protein
LKISAARAWAGCGCRLRLDEKEWPLVLNGLDLDVVIDDWPFVAKMRSAKQGRRKIRVVGQAQLNNILTPFAYDISQTSIHGLPWSLHGFALKPKANNFAVMMS